MENNLKEKQHNSDIIIEVANAQDISGIAHVQKETWLDTYPNEEIGITKEDILLKDFDSKEKINNRKLRLAKYYKDNSGRVWVAKEGTEVVGFAGATRENGRNRLGALYVLPESQGQGIGARLIETLLNWLGNDKDIVLNVVSYNQTKHFYEKYGFVENGPVEDDPAGALPNGKQLPEIEMVRRKQ